MSEETTNISGANADEGETPAESELEQSNSSAPICHAWLEEARRQGESDQYPAKRCSTRYEWAARLEVKYKTPKGHEVVFNAEGLQISEQGIGFRCREPVEPYTSVEITVCGENSYAKAIVRHCTRSLRGYKIGAEFE